MVQNAALPGSAKEVLRRLQLALGTQRGGDAVVALVEAERALAAARHGGSGQRAVAARDGRHRGRADGRSRCCTTRPGSGSPTGSWPWRSRCRRWWPRSSWPGRAPRFRSRPRRRRNRSLPIAIWRCCATAWLWRPGGRGSPDPARRRRGAGRRLRVEVVTTIRSGVRWLMHPQGRPAGGPAELRRLAKALGIPLALARPTHPTGRSRPTCRRRSVARRASTAGSRVIWRSWRGAAASPSVLAGPSSGARDRRRGEPWSRRSGPDRRALRDARGPPARAAVRAPTRSAARPRETAESATARDRSAGTPTRSGSGRVAVPGGLPGAAPGRVPSPRPAAAPRLRERLAEPIRGPPWAQRTRSSTGPGPRCGRRCVREHENWTQWQQLDRDALAAQERYRAVAEAVDSRRRAAGGAGGSGPLAPVAERGPAWRARRAAPRRRRPRWRSRPATPASRREQAAQARQECIDAITPAVAAAGQGGACPSSRSCG